MIQPRRKDTWGTHPRTIRDSLKDSVRIEGIHYCCAIWSSGYASPTGAGTPPPHCGWRRRGNPEWIAWQRGHANTEIPFMGYSRYESNTDASGQSGDRSSVARAFSW